MFTYCINIFNKHKNTNFKIGLLKVRDVIIVTLDYKNAIFSEKR